MICEHRSSPSSVRDPASVRAELLVAAHQTPAAMVDHDRQILVSPLAGDLVDPHPLQSAN